MARSTPPAEESGENFLLGKLLVAMPGMSDPRFERSVIFMCAHSAEGAMGLIVNKPIENLAFGELMIKFGLESGPDGLAMPILFGGPVRMDRGFVLHSAEYAGDATTLAVPGEIALSASQDILRAIATGHGPQKSALALGYAGWGAGQIESEILANGWIHCDADANLVFDTAYEAMWQKAVGKLGVDISGLSAQSGRA